MSQNKLISATILLLSGCLLTLSFAPFNISILSILGISLLNYTLLNKTPKQAFTIGTIFGLGFFGSAVSWVFVSINEFGNANYLLAGIITLGFIALLSLFIGCQSVMLAKLFPHNKSLKAIAAFPIIWVVFEWLRSFIFTGFPWAYLGYGQLSSPLKNFAPIIGVYGVSLICCFIAGLITDLANKYSAKKLLGYILIIASLYSSGYLLANKSWTKAETTSHSISLIQGNINPTDKFLLSKPIEKMRVTYEKLTRENLESEYIIWPENSLPMPLPWAQKYLHELNLLAKKHNNKLLIGMPVHIKNTNNFYNAIVAIGDASGQYHKKKLVPFGDYLPFSELLDPILKFFNIPMSSFVHGSDSQENLITPGNTLEPLICYEIAYPELVRTMVKTNNSDAILNISEDGWFGKSLGPHQHLDIARMRALETGRFVLRGTTTGISAIINPHGNIIKQSPQFKAFVLTGEFIAHNGNTPWMYIGSINLMLILIVLLVILRMKYGCSRGFTEKL